ncbi:MAG: glycosyltransferase [Oscillochloris sp.]|nr:glycosyltransferase [Oscillochloris sp.]
MHRALRAADADSWMLTAQATRGDERVITPRGLRRLWQRAALPIDQLPGRLAGAVGFTSGWTPAGLPGRVAALGAEIVHLHWTVGMAAVHELPQLRRPLVWTLHDLWPLTGGCHYPGTCAGFTAACGHCPLLRGDYAHDLSWRIRRHKAGYWADVPLAFVAPSRWMAEQIRRSSLFGGHQVSVIPYGFDLQVFRPQVRAAARAHLGLPPERKIVLFGAIRAEADPRKGFDLLQAAVAHLAHNAAADTIDLALFGSHAPPPELGLPVHNFGPIGMMRNWRNCMPPPMCLWRPRVRIICRIPWPKPWPVARHVSPLRSAASPT